MEKYYQIARPDKNLGTTRTDKRLKYLRTGETPIVLMETKTYGPGIETTKDGSSLVPGDTTWELVVGNNMVELSERTFSELSLLSPREFLILESMCYDGPNGMEIQETVATLPEGRTLSFVKIKAVSIPAGFAYPCNSPLETEEITEPSRTEPETLWLMDQNGELIERQENSRLDGWRDAVAPVIDNREKPSSVTVFYHIKDVGEAKEEFSVDSFKELERKWQAHVKTNLYRWNKYIDRIYAVKHVPVMKNACYKEILSDIEYLTNHGMRMANGLKPQNENPGDELFADWLKSQIDMAWYRTPEPVPYSRHRDPYWELRQHVRETKPVLEKRTPMWETARELSELYCLNIHDVAEFLAEYMMQNRSLRKALVGVK